MVSSNERSQSTMFDIILLELLFKPMIDFEHIRENNFCTTFCHSQNMTCILLYINGYSVIDSNGAVVFINYAIKYFLVAGHIFWVRNAVFLLSTVLKRIVLQCPYLLILSCSIRLNFSNLDEIGTIQ